MKPPLPALLLAAVSAAAPGEALPGLPRSRPEAQGVSSAAIRAFVEAAEEKIDALHSFMLVRHGHVVAEGWWSPYGPGDPHMLYSLSKSFTSTAVGMAVAEGRLGLDDPVLGAFPEDAPAEPGDNLKAMRVRDLLAMSTGQHADAVAKFSFNGEERLTRAFLALPVAHKPGTHFFYNTPASYMLSAMVQRATGSNVLDYLRPRLFEPLGIANPTWEASRQGVTLGGYGLKARTEDIARFAQLYLQKGMWNGQRLLPAEWVDLATARQTSNGSSPTSDWEQGYGYQFWRCRHGLYRGDGAFGQFAIVMPEQDAVVAITSGTRDMAGVMNLVWGHLLPAMKEGPLPEDAAGAEALAARLRGLSLRPPAGQPTSKLAARVSGRRYLLGENDDKIEALSLDFTRGSATLVMRTAGKESRVDVGRGSWGGRGTLATASGEERVSASGAWTADDAYVVKVALYETPFVVTLGLRFRGDEVLVDREQNVSFGPTKRPQVVGRAEAR